MGNTILECSTILGKPSRQALDEVGEECPQQGRQSRKKGEMCRYSLHRKTANSAQLCSQLMTYIEEQLTMPHGGSTGILKYIASGLNIGGGFVLVDTYLDKYNLPGR